MASWRACERWRRGRTAPASLIREAVDRVYGEDIEDVRIGEARLARYLADPKTAIPLEQIIAEEERLHAKAV